MARLGAAVLLDPSEKRTPTPFAFEPRPEAEVERVIARAKRNTKPGPRGPAAPGVADEYHAALLRLPSAVNAAGEAHVPHGTRAAAQVVSEEDSDEAAIALAVAILMME